MIYYNDKITAKYYRTGPFSTSQTCHVILIPPDDTGHGWKYASGENHFLDVYTAQMLRIIFERTGEKNDTDTIKKHFNDLIVFMKILIGFITVLKNKIFHTKYNLEMLFYFQDRSMYFCICGYVIV